MQTPLELVTTGINLLYATGKVDRKKKNHRASSEALHRGSSRNIGAIRQSETENVNEAQVLSKLPYIDHPSARVELRNAKINSVSLPRDFSPPTTNLSYTAKPPKTIS